MSRRFAPAGLRRTNLRDWDSPDTGPFTPASLSSLWAWWLMDSTNVTVTGGTAVTGVTDKSGNGRNLTELSSATRPIFEATSGSFSNIDCIRLNTDGATHWDFLNMPDMSALTAGHIFMVCKLDADPGAQGRAGLWSIGTGAGSNFYDNPGDSTIYDAFGSNARKTTGAFATTITNIHIYEAISTGSEWTNRNNGTQIFTTATNTVGFKNAPVLGGNGADVGMLGRIGEVVMCSAKLSVADRASLISYFNTRYGISST